MPAIDSSEAMRPSPSGALQNDMEQLHISETEQGSKMEKLPDSIEPIQASKPYAKLLIIIVLIIVSFVAIGILKKEMIGQLFSATAITITLRGINENIDTKSHVTMSNIKNQTYCTNCFFGHNYTWVNISSDLFLEWYPSHLDQCVFSGYSINYCVSSNNASTYRSPYHWNWSNFVPESLLVMPVGFDAEKGPNHGKLADLFKHFYQKNIVLINIGDSVSLQFIRSIQYEIKREYGENMIISPPFIELYDRKFIDSADILEFSILVPVDNMHTTMMEFKIVHIRNYDCKGMYSKVVNVMAKYKKKHNSDIGYKWKQSPQFAIVYNLGLHCHSYKEYVDILSTDFNAFQLLTDFDITFFYKQTSVQHFRTATGEYNVSSMNSSVITLQHKCAPVSLTQVTMYENAEDKVIQEAYSRYLKSGKTLNQVNVLPFRHTRRYWDLHTQRAGDCTHFGEYAPLMYKPVFNTMYNYFL